MDNRLEVLKGRMSERLITVGESLGTLHFDSFTCTADVGCDHGYISMYLVLSGISQKAIAMDLRKGPLSAAEDNIREFEISDRVQVRLSDGLEGLSEGEADSLVIAGMGGKLMIGILEKRDIPSLGIKAGVLQPQSDIPEFRGYLRECGFEIVDECIVFEDGKYYFPMAVAFTGDGKKYDESLNLLMEKLSVSRQDAIRLSDKYGLYNILRRDDLLKVYLEHGREVDISIKENLDTDRHPERYGEVEKDLSDIELLLNFFN